MPQVNLDRGLWYSDKGISVRTATGDPSAIAQELRSVDNTDELTRWAQKQNGFFAAVITRHDQVWLVADRVRSIPLYYAVDSHGTIAVADSADRIRRLLDSPRLDQTACREYLNGGYVTGSATLVQGVEQVRAGQIQILSHGSTTPARQSIDYWMFCRQGEALHMAPAELEAEWRASITSSVSRLVSVADGRQIVIPLSAGNDSRLIATELARQKYPNLLAYTYGLKGNAESRVSNEVARLLGIRWIFVPYTPEMWSALASSSRYNDYVYAAGDLSSLAHIQDWPAVQALVRDGHVDDNSIFTPGHTGDFLGGHQIRVDLLRDTPISTQDIAQSICDRHLAMWSGSGLPVDVKRQAGAIDEYRPDGQWNATSATSACDTWNWRERQAKFIVNSVRVYDFHKLDWWLPLWDAEYAEFWSRVPWQVSSEGETLRLLVQRLFEEVTVGRSVSDLCIPPKDTAKSSTHQSGSPRARAKQLLPEGAMRTLRRIKQTQVVRRRNVRDLWDDPLGWSGLILYRDTKLKAGIRPHHINALLSLAGLRTWMHEVEPRMTFDIDELLR